MTKNVKRWKMDFRYVKFRLNRLTIKEWLDETKHQEILTKTSLPIVNNACPGSNNVPKVREWGSINPDSGKGTRVKSSRMKSGKLRTYEEWDKIEKELEKELQEEEKRNEAQAASGDNKGTSLDLQTAEKPSSKGLREKAKTMPKHVRAVHAQREKEKGNEALIAGDYNEALGYYERSLIFEPTAAVYNNRALLYLKQKKWKLSVEDCNRVLKEEPENIKALLRRSQALYELHSLDKAQTDLEFVLKLEPGNAKATALLKKVKEDRASRQRSNLEGGRRMVIDEVDDDDSGGEEDEDEEEGKEEGSEEEEKAMATEGPQRWAIPENQPVDHDVVIEEVFDLQESAHSKKRVHVEEGDVSPGNANRVSADVEKLSDVKPRGATDSGGVANSRNSSERVQQSRRDLIQRLKQTGPNRLQAVLGVKLDAEMLEEYIFALSTISLPQGDYEFIYSVLDGLTRSARFKVAVLLLEDAALKALEDIFDGLYTSTLSTTHNIAELKCKFSS
uniref:RPAP3_C domain-containing protein n=1 Tax=Mesocestoides corti TaxID=53468 RepID=A0A5K3F9L0_MESCO